MLYKTFVLIAFVLTGGNLYCQDNPWMKFTIETGICHNAKPLKITVVAKKNTLKRFMRSESVKFDNCNYLMENSDQIISKAAPTDPPPGGGDSEEIWVKDPGEFLELCKREKAEKPSGEICIDSEGNVSFSIGVGDAKLSINTQGKFSLSAKSADGITRTAEF